MNAFISLLSLLLLLATGALAQSRPNVIVIMTDDQGYGDLSCHGNPTQQTPNLDRLHAESLRFTDFHVSPFCTPSRAALMTGRYPARTGAWRTSSGRTSLHEREQTLGDLFTVNGYATGMFGKWHLGDCAPSRPMDCGFEQSVWHRCGGLTQISDFWGNDYFDDVYLVGDQPKPFKGYCTDVWFDETMRFISESVTDAGGNKPFFAYLPTNAPHGPFIVGQRWKQPYLDLGLPEKQAAFKGMVANVDWNLGRLLDYLDREKLADNTLLLFLTDNGTSAGAEYDKAGRIVGWPKDPRENANMRGGKSSAYDGGHRVPLFIRWPKGQLGEPRDIATLTAHLDLTPTLIELCGMERPTAWPALDGRSMVPLMRDAKADWEPRLLHAQMHGGIGFAAPGDPWKIGVAMSERWRLVEGRELYDIEADPAQRTNVAAQHPGVVARLDAAHRAWFAEIEPSMEPTRILLGSEQENPVPLSCQEWVMDKGNPPTSTRQAIRRSLVEGPWHVKVAQPGRYRFTLSAVPLDQDQAIQSSSARIEIGGQTREWQIDEPESDRAAVVELELEAGPTLLRAWLTRMDGKQHGAYFVSVERVIESGTPTILWAQYGLSQDTLKLSVHTDLDPLRPVTGSVRLELKRGASWEEAATAPIDPLTAMATFRLPGWDASQSQAYRVRLGGSSREGLIRAEPAADEPFRLMAVACVNDKWFPYEAAVTQMIQQNPDLVFFAGDQIYESNAGGQTLSADTEADVPAAMANYLAKWRRFGLTFRDLLKDRPSIMITDDHDVYANDLWGDGGRRMTGDRTTGGYPMHPDWVNAVEATQTWHLPDPVNPGPWGDGIRAYYSSLEYGGVRFAILEDRKFKSPPSSVISTAVTDPRNDKPNRTLEVIMDPAFDAQTLDRPELHLLGSEQEAFLGSWAKDVARRKQLAVVLSQSPFANLGNYDVLYGDMDANGWPQSARKRAIQAIAPSQALMIAGDIHFATLHQHGAENWGDGPWGFSLPPFAANQNRGWGPSVPAQGRAIAGRPGSGNHHDRFGNKVTMAATGPGVMGYGTIDFDKTTHRMTCHLHTFDEHRQPAPAVVPGWPHVIQVER